MLLREVVYIYIYIYIYIYTVEFFFLLSLSHLQSFLNKLLTSGVKT